jgi:hypothetical protein
MMTDRAGESPADNAIPIAYRGQRFPSRQALADHLAPLVGKTRSTMRTLLSRYDGDVERTLASRRRPITFEGQAFPHRKALAQYLAPRLHRPIRSVEGLLRCHNDDVAAVLLARPYRQRPAASQGVERAEAIKGVATMITRRHWFSYGTDPSWFLRIECDRCGKVQMVSEAHMKRGAMPIRDIIARIRHDGCGGLAAKAEPLTGIEGASSRPVRKIVLRDT